jgi:hypothetical protein
MTALARKVVDMLGSHVMSAVLPKDFGDFLRAPGYATTWVHQIPHGAHGGFAVRYTVSPAAEISMEVLDINGVRQWEGTLISE